MVRTYKFGGATFVNINGKSYRRFYEAWTSRDGWLSGNRNAYLGFAMDEAIAERIAERSGGVVVECTEEVR